MEEFYDSVYGNNVTISNEFLSKYLSDTKPEYIKVFLFYLWKGVKEKYSIEDASNELDLDVKDVEMALKYWVKKKIMKKECLEMVNSLGSDSTKLVDFDAKKKELINKNRKEYSEIEQDLLFSAEKILKKTLTERQVDLIAKCYNEFMFDESVIYYLFEYCFKISKTSANYMKTVAESWYEQNVRTASDAKKIIESFEKKQNRKSASKGNLASGSKAMANAMDRDEYNEWFKNKFLSNA